MSFSSNFGGYPWTLYFAPFCALIYGLRLHCLYLTHKPYNCRSQINFISQPWSLKKKKTPLHLVLEIHYVPIPCGNKWALRHVSDESGLWNEQRLLWQAIMETEPNFLIIFLGKKYTPLRHLQLLHITKHVTTTPVRLCVSLSLQDALGHAMLPVSCTFHTPGEL